MIKIKQIIVQMKRKRFCYLFISPFFVLFFVFVISPILYSFYLSFYRHRGLRNPPSFIGLTNYFSLLSDSSFLKGLINTLIYTGVQMSVTLLLAIGLAFLLNSPAIRFKKIFRLIYFFPVFTSLVVAALIFRLIFEQDTGMVNILLSKVGIPKLDWLGDPTFGLISLIIVGIWRQLGIQFIIILAGLQNISRDIIEAAVIDGASNYKIVRYVVLPLLFPVIFFVFITQSILALQLFEQPYILAGGSGGPGNSMLTLALYQYLTAFMYFKFGYASAIAYMIVVIIILFTVTQMRILGGKAGIVRNTGN